jgi:hypothetical protein
MTTTHTTRPRLRFPACLEERVIGPDDPGYDEARGVFSPRIDRRPAAIVRPWDAAEVAAVVALAREPGSSWPSAAAGTARPATASATAGSCSTWRG